MSERAGRDDVLWWKSKKEDVYQHVTALVRRIRDKQSMRESMDLHHMRLYQAQDLSGFGPDSYWRTPNGYQPSTLAFNVVRSAVDTVQSKIAKNRPLPMVLTSGGNYEQQKRARDLGRFIEGEFDRCKVFELGTHLVKDVGIFGTGIVKVFRKRFKDVKKDCVGVERVLPFELVIDAVESQYGTPRSVFQRKWIDKHQLAAKFPKFRADIEGAINSADDDRESIDDATSDQILVIEAWRLPDDDESPGRHSIVCNAVTLFDEEWKHDYFPFISLRKNKPTMGYWGDGFAQELCGIQYEINFTAMRIQKAHRVMGGSMWLLHANSNIVTSHLSSDAGVAVKWSGDIKPEAFTPQPINPASYEYMMALRNTALQEPGVSQMSARAEKPQGVTAAVALETLDDIETERFYIFGKEYENWAIEVAAQMIGVAKDIASDNPNYEVRAIGNRSYRIIRFADVDLDRDSWVMRCFPTSLLAKGPAERMQQVTDWVNIGWISPTEGKMLLQMPDLDRLTSLSTSSHEYVQEVLEKLADGDPEDPDLYEAPEPYINLADALSTAQAAYLRAKLDGVPDPNLRLMRQWIQACLTEQKKGQAPANANAGPPGAPPGMPPGAPMNPTGGGLGGAPAVPNGTMPGPAPEPVAA